jgi:hypothetical protein
MISGVSKVVVPLDDQERAKEFWVDPWSALPAHMCALVC